MRYTPALVVLEERIIEHISRDSVFDQCIKLVKNCVSIVSDKYIIVSQCVYCISVGELLVDGVQHSRFLLTDTCSEEDKACSHYLFSCCLAAVHAQRAVIQDPG